MDRSVELWLELAWGLRVSVFWLSGSVALAIGGAVRTGLRCSWLTVLLWSGLLLLVVLLAGLILSAAFLLVWHAGVAVLLVAAACLLIVVSVVVALGLVALLLSLLLAALLILLSGLIALLLVVLLPALFSLLIVTRGLLPRLLSGLALRVLSVVVLLLLLRGGCGLGWLRGSWCRAWAFAEV